MLPKHIARNTYTEKKLKISWILMPISILFVGGYLIELHTGEIFFVVIGHQICFESKRSNKSRFALSIAPLSERLTRPDAPTLDTGHIFFGLF